MRPSKVWWGPLALTVLALVLALLILVQPVGDLLKYTFLYSVVTIYFLLMAIYWGGYQGAMMGMRFGTRPGAATLDRRPTGLMVGGGVVGVLLGALVGLWWMSLGVLSLHVCFFC